MSVADALERLAEKATPGPWKLHGAMLGFKGDLFSPTAKQVRDCHHIARFYAPKPDRKPLCDLEAIGARQEAITQIEANAELVVALVSHLPTIIEALKALERVDGEGGVKS